jgi:hypothetical protein
MMEPPDAAADALWPGPEYSRQVECLRAAIGETVYLVELASTDVQLGIRQTGRPYLLLDVVPYPRPDPTQGLAPHLILLDDGRGVNLGRIARISLEQPFAPAPHQVLYRDPLATDRLLFADRTLSPALIAERSQQLLGQVLGREPRGGTARVGTASAPPLRMETPQDEPIGHLDAPEADHAETASDVRSVARESDAQPAEGPASDMGGGVEDIGRRPRGSPS